MFDSIGRWFDNLSGPKKVATVIVSIAAGVGSVTGAVLGVINVQEKLSAKAEAANPLELVDVGFTELQQHPPDPDGLCEVMVKCSVPAVDFTVTNSGENPVIIERADIRVKKIWTFEAPYVQDPDVECASGALPPSLNYDMKLPTKGAPYTLPTSLSQGIKPNDVDRFTISPARDERTATTGEK